MGKRKELLLHSISISWAFVAEDFSRTSLIPAHLSFLGDGLGSSWSQLAHRDPKSAMKPTWIPYNIQYNWI
jgi:hypothetical protein